MGIGPYSRRVQYDNRDNGSRKCSAITSTVFGLSDTKLGNRNRLVLDRTEMEGDRNCL